MRPFKSTPYLILGLLGAASSTLFGTSTTVEPTEPESDVVSLTQDTFYTFMETHPLVLANFYAPWCRYSKRLTPHFEKAATVLKEEDIPLVKIDCTVEEELCKDFRIPGYPTMNVFRGPWEFEEYEGARRAEAIISYMLEESMSTEAGDDFYYQSPLFN